MVEGGGTVPAAEWDRVLAAQEALQRHFPECVLLAT